MSEQPTITTPPAAPAPEVPPAPVPTALPVVLSPPVPAAPAPTPSPTTLRDPDGSDVTSDKLKERIERAKEQERTALLAKLGFKTIEEAEAAGRKIAEEQARAEEQRRATLTREQQLSEELERERTARVALEEKERKAREELEQRLIEERVQRSALAAGVRPEEVDYALYEFGRAARAMSEDDVRALDPTAWFSTVLKQKKPHVFGSGSVGVPATTGVVGDAGGAPPAPKPTGAPAVKDAMAMTPKEFQEHLAKLGAGV